MLFGPHVNLSLHDIVMKSRRFIGVANAWLPSRCQFRYDRSTVVDWLRRSGTNAQPLDCSSNEVKLAPHSQTFIGYSVQRCKSCGHKLVPGFGV